MTPPDTLIADDRLVGIAQRVLGTEAEAVAHLAQNLPADFGPASGRILQAIVSGILGMITADRMAELIGQLRALDDLTKSQPDFHL